MGLPKSLRPIFRIFQETNAWKKLVDPKVSRGQTGFPKSDDEQERLGVRFDYDGDVEQDGITYCKWQMQPNAGKIPSSIKLFRNENGGTHSVMGVLLVKKGGSRSEFLEEFLEMAENLKR